MDIERLRLCRALTTAMILMMLAISVDQEADFQAMDDFPPMDDSSPLDAFMPPKIPSPSGRPLRLPSERSFPREIPLTPAALPLPSENPVDRDPIPATPSPPDTPQAPTTASPDHTLLFPPAPAPSPPPDPVEVACDSKCILDCQYARPVVYVYDLCFRMCKLKCMIALRRLIDRCADKCALAHPTPALVITDDEKMESRVISCIRKCMKHH